MDLSLFNRRLHDYFGDSELGVLPRYRIVFSETQLEKRVIKLHGLTPIAEEVPKYPQIRPPKFILEHYQVNTSDELAALYTYEPLWVFGIKGDPNGEPIEPTWLAIEFLINLLHHRSHAPYMATEDGTAESRRAEVVKLYDSLFGNETSVGDALAHKEGVTVPSNFGD